GLIKKQIIGGVLLLKGSSNEFENMNSHFNNLAEISNCPPLFVSSDSEPTLINKKISGLPSFMAANEVRSVTECRILASDIAIAIKKFGCNYNYAPVCDFSNNKEIIGNRSFGNNEQELIELAEAFISETQANNIIATAK